MIRSPNIRLGLALLLLSGLAIPVRASETKGTVRSVKADSNEIVIKGLVAEATYEMSRDTSVCVDGKKSALGDLREGDQVMVHYEKINNRLLASEIRALRNAKEATGTVRSALSDKRQVVLKGVLKDTTYEVDKDATIRGTGKNGTLADLRDGEHVRITYEQRGDQLVARDIHVTRK